MILKGMTLKQYTEIVELSQKLHAFAHYPSEEEVVIRAKEYPLLPNRWGFSIKYIDCCYDSRDKKVWSITFRRGSDGVKFSCNHFASLTGEMPKNWKYDNLYDLCKAYLTGEFKPKEEFNIPTN